MTSLSVASTTYLTKITPTHSTSTITTYRRNFDVIINPYFGPEEPIETITNDKLTAFLESKNLLNKPNGQPRAIPTLGQITGLLRGFLNDAKAQGLLPNTTIDATTLGTTRRRHQPKIILCSNCKAAINTQGNASERTASTKLAEHETPQGQDEPPSTARPNEKPIDKNATKPPITVNTKTAAKTPTKPAPKPTAKKERHVKTHEKAAKKPTPTKHSGKTGRRAS